MRPSKVSPDSSEKRPVLTLLSVWNRNTLQLTHDFPFHSGPVNCLSVRPDGELFVSASGDGTIMLWDLNKCKLIKKLYQGTPGLACIAFTARRKGFGAPVLANLTFSG